MQTSDFALISGAYLLGSISFSYWAVKHQLGRDVRSMGSGNAGATNVLRVAGLAPALVVFAGDVGKGILAVLVAQHRGAVPLVVGAVTIAVVMGHMFPIFHGFRGGKGVATAAGAVGTLMPLAALVAVVVFGLVVVATRYVALGSIGAVTSCPLAAVTLAQLGWMADPGTAAITATTVVTLLIVWLHRSNIRRIWSGTEWRLGDPR